MFHILMECFKKSCIFKPQYSLIIVFMNLTKGGFGMNKCPSFPKLFIYDLCFDLFTCLRLKKMQYLYLVIIDANSYIVARPFEIHWIHLHYRMWEDGLSSTMVKHKVSI